MYTIISYYCRIWKRMTSLLRLCPEGQCLVFNLQLTFRFCPILYASNNIMLCGMCLAHAQVEYLSVHPATNAIIELWYV